MLSDEAVRFIANLRVSHRNLSFAHLREANVGYGASCDAYHITSPDPVGDGLRRALLQALKDGEINVEEIDYVNAHGTSTQKNDEFETVAYKAAFGKSSNQYCCHLNLNRPQEIKRIG